MDFKDLISIVLTVLVSKVCRDVQLLNIMPPQTRSPLSPNMSVSVSDEAHFWLNGYVNKQNYRIWSEANPQVYVETPLHPEKLTVWCALWTGGILLQKR
ncbi:hypothetical protein TNCV_507901 [Trichonephila clavipes]|nr:hypothetical protein TNCV_507901 [Trichonephila clavipes]